MLNFERFRRFYKLIWAVPAGSPILPPEPPSTEDKIAEKAYEKAIEEYEKRKEARKKLHQDTSTTIRRIYYALISTILFCFSVMHGRKDLSFISANSNIKLPIVNVDVRYTVFLLVAPSVIIGLTAYIHIFIEEHRKVAIEKEDRTTAIFNMENIAARGVSHLIFYWLPSLTLFYFAWIAQPLRFGGPILLVATAATALALLFLQLRRTGRHLGNTLLVSLGFVVAVSICTVLYMKSAREFSLDRETIVNQDLTIMTLAGASLEGVIMTGVDLNEVNLRGANLSGATIEDSELNAADLTGANLAGATFNNVELIDANLTGAILSNATLVDRVRVDFALLHHARLDGADLSGALELKAVQIEGACGDRLTRLPPNLVGHALDLVLPPCVRRENSIIVGAAPLRGQIDQPEGRQEFTFGITDTGLYQIDVAAAPSESSELFDPLITVHGPKLESELFDDDSGSNADSRIVHRFEPDLYTLTVAEYNGLPGYFSVRVGDWDGRSISSFDEIKVPSAAEISLNLTIDQTTPVETVRVPHNVETGLTWINLENPEGRNVVVTAKADEGSELVMMLFDAAAAYTPIAHGPGGSTPSIRCTLGLDRYLILAGSFFDEPDLDLTVALLDDSAKDPLNHCFEN